MTENHGHVHGQGDGQQDHGHDHGQGDCHEDHGHDHGQGDCQEDHGHSDGQQGHSHGHGHGHSDGQQEICVIPGCGRPRSGTSLYCSLDCHDIGTSQQHAFPKLPVLVLTGYLGAGKTTLLNYLLKEQRDKKLAVIENEVGEVSIDDVLVEEKHEDLAEELVVLANGCVCCTLRGDLIKTLRDIATKRKNGLVLDGVLIELTGAADPAPVVQTFMMDEEVRSSFFIDNVIALVDAKYAIQKLDESERDQDVKGTACAQIAFSSTVLLNKIDLVDPEMLVQVEGRIKQVNSTVDIIRCEQARVPVTKLFNIHAFDLSRVLEEQYMDEEEFNQFYTPKMDHTISNVGIRCKGAINMSALQLFINKYLDDDESAKDFLRIKGVVHVVMEDRMFVIQCVHMMRNQSFEKEWEIEADERENRMIFIGRGMQERRKELTDGFMACLAQPLRFPIGAKVKARMGEHTYIDGTVLAHWDNYSPYRIQLDNGDVVFAPVDTDTYVESSDAPQGLCVE